MPPVQGSVKINVDGTVSMRERHGAVGEVCRDQYGAFLGASAIVFKALAIRETLSIADDLYARRIHVASDCKVVVDDLHQGKLAAYGAVLREISHRSSIFLSCNIVHEFRSSNY